MCWATVLVDLVPYGAPGAKGTVNKQDLTGDLKLWFIQMREGIYTGYCQGLPQTDTTPMVHSEVAASSQIHKQIIKHEHGQHPKIDKHSGLQYTPWWVKPNLRT